MRQNIQFQYRNVNNNPIQTSRSNYTSSNQHTYQNHTYQPTNINSRLPLRNQIQTYRNGNISRQNISTQESITSPNISQERNQIHVTRSIPQINNSGEENNLNENNNNIRSMNQMGRNPQTNIIVNKNSGLGINQKANSTNNSFQNLGSKKNTNISRNVVKNVKYNIDISNVNKPKNVRSKKIDESDKGNHTRAKSYFTEREHMSNYLPKQVEAQKRISHSVEVKRKTINRGDKYNNIQITHIISASKPILEKTDFHIFEKLSTVELNRKPLDLSKIKLYIKKDPSVKTNYYSSCTNVPLKSAEKVTKVTHYQHASGRGMTNLKSNNLNKKYYQSNIVTLPSKETKKSTPKVKYINEFRFEKPNTNRNNSMSEKLNTNFNFNKTYDLSYTEREKYKNKENIKSNYQPHKEKEIEEKNKDSNINYNDINNKKNILPLNSRGNIYTTRTYTARKL